ncbi:MAG: hypothetical protein LBV21_00195 [Candidatus Adiutrix sp.]|jgi:hypothetical protein|nr:hypothetical protein [Candidatus Adiutrix sp.]
MTPTHRPTVARPAPRGLVLAFTLIILLLMSLMGLAILLNSRTELAIAGNTSIGRDAFNTADSAARLATLLGRLVLHPELGPPDRVLAAAAGGSGGPAFPLTVKISPQFDLGRLKEEAGDYSHTTRYIRAGGWVGRGQAGGRDYEPHLIFTAPDSGRTKTVATAALGLDLTDPSSAGLSLSGGDAYDQSGGGSLEVHMAVSVNARATGRPAPAASDQAAAFDGGALDEPRSIITILFREIM